MRQEAPRAAGWYLGARGGVVTELYPMTNADRSPEHFSLLPEEQFAVVRKARGSGVALAGVGHSHPASPARMSAEDLRLALDPDTRYVIVSLLTRETRCFRVGAAGEVVEEPVEAV